MSLAREAADRVWNAAERARAEEALREREAQLKLFVETSPASRAIFDTKMRYLAVSRRFVEDFHLHAAASDLIGQNLYEVVPDIPERWKAVHERCLSGSVERSENDLFTRADGTQEWLRWEMQPWLDRTGQVGGSVFTCEVITARKKAEDALSQSEQELRQTLETAPVGLVRNSRDLRYISVNSAYANIAGLPVERILGRQLVEVMGHEAFEVIRPYVECVLRGERVEYEAELPWSARGPRWIHVIYTPFVEQGEVTGWVASVADITDRKRGEQELAKDLTALTRMHGLSTRLLDENGLQPLLQEVMDAAVAISDAQLGTVQLIEGNTLRMAAHHGHDRRFLEFFSEAAMRESVSGEVMKRAARVVVEDVESSPIFTGSDSLGVLRGAGVRGVQSTPIVSRAGAMLGILTTQWTAPHAPAQRDLWRVDLLVRQAAELIERARNEEELRRSEERLRLATEHAEIGFWDVHPVNDVLTWPPLVKAMFGISPDAPVSMQDFYNGLHPEDREATSQGYAAAADPNRRALYDVEYRTIGKEDGIVRWVAAKGRGIFDAEGRCVRVIGTAIDITKRKTTESALVESEERLRKSEERFRLAQKAAGVGTFEWNIETGVNTWTPELEQLYGLPQGSFGGTQPSWESLVHLEDRANAMGKVEEAFQTGEPAGTEWRVLWPDSSIHWIAGRWQVFKDAAGKPLRMVGVNIDITARKAAEKAVRESLTKLEAALSGITDAVFIADADGKLIHTNEAFARYHRFKNTEECSQSISDWPNRSFLQIFLPDGTEAPPELWPLARALRGESAGSYEYTLRRKATGETWAGSYSFGPILAEDGGITGAVVVARDITERKRAERAIVESERQFRTLANAIPQLCWMANGDGWIFWYNERWYEYTGTTPAEMEGWGWESVHDPRVLPEVLQRWKRAIATGTPFEMVFPLKGADGGYRPFLTRIVPVRDDSGQIVFWFGTNTDITEQRKTEDALRDSQERLRLAQEAGGVGVWDWTPDTGEENFSDEMNRIYGLEPRTVRTYADWLSRVHPDDIAPMQEQRDTDIRERRPFNLTFRVYRSSGEVRWINAKGRATYNPSGHIAQVLGVNIDITDQKRIEEELRQSAAQIRQLNAELEARVQERTAQLQAANQELEAFAYSVSHDLRAPLRGIDGWSLALSEDYRDRLDERGQEYLNLVRSETQRMGLLIEDLLTLSRITRSEVRFAAVDLSAIATSVSARLLQRNIGRNIRFEIQPNLIVHGDERLLEIALTNLLENAVKFTGKKKEALIEVAATDRRTVMVRDNGTGFDMKYASTLFGAFQRLHKASEFPGTGIGLATVQRIIHRHGGRIWANAEPGTGARFLFTLGQDK